MVVVPFPQKIPWHPVVSLRYHRNMALTLRTDEELDRVLTELADSEGLSRQEVIRRAVLDRYERAGHRSRVDLIAGQVLVDYAEALERLGTV